jgi:hypothetical protein
MGSPEVGLDEPPLLVPVPPMQRPLTPFKLAFRLALLILLALFLGAVSIGAQLVTPRAVPVFQEPAD